MSTFCAHCGQNLPSNTEGWIPPVCPACGRDPNGMQPQAAPFASEPGPASPMAQDMPAPPPPEAPALAPPPPPLEWREEPAPGIAWEAPGNFFARMGKTIWRMICTPGLALQAPGKPGLAWPLSFTLILGTLVMGLDALVHGPLPFLPARLPLALHIAFVPVWVAVFQFLEAGVVHLFLLMIGGAKKGFTATFRAIGYATTGNIFMLLPWVGPLVSLVWGLVMLVAGLAGAHGIGKGRAFTAAVVFPVILLLVIGLILVLVLASFHLGAVRKFPSLSL